MKIDKMFILHKYQQKQTFTVTLQSIVQKHIGISTYTLMYKHIFAEKKINFQTNRPYLQQIGLKIA